MNSKIYLLFFVCHAFICKPLAADPAQIWQTFWQRALEEKTDPQEALILLEKALCLMTEKEIQETPALVVEQVNLLSRLKNYPKVLEASEKVILSQQISDYQRLNLGILRFSAYTNIGDENSALKEFEKYITHSPIMPKYEFLDDLIIIKNIPDNETLQNQIQHFMVNNYGILEEDISKYDGVWFIKWSNKVITNY